jgi:hypothetical protein
MKRPAITLALAFTLLTACVNTQFMAPASPESPEAGIQGQPLTGQSGDVEFSVSDEVFNVERPSLVHLLLVAIYLPLVFM